MSRRLLARPAPKIDPEIAEMDSILRAFCRLSPAGKHWVRSKMATIPG